MLSSNSKYTRTCMMISNEKEFESRPKEMDDKLQNDTFREDRR